MTNAATIEPSGAKAERTRATILSAAEDLFSRQGYAATRLEDVADVVGVKRAALFYYYRDKQTLYDAMLLDAFGSLSRRLNEIVLADRSVAERIELAAGAWVDAIVARPTLARLILRLVADGTAPATHGVFLDDNKLAMQFLALFQQGCRNGDLKPLHDNPFHAASAVVGTTVFFVAALAALVPQGRFEPLGPGQVAAHKQEVLFALRRSLGMTGTDRKSRSVKKKAMTKAARAAS